MSALEEYRRVKSEMAMEFMKLATDAAELERRVAELKEKAKKNYIILDDSLDKETK